MSKRLGKQTILLDQSIYLTESFTCVGEKESEGPLKNHFDICLSDDKWGEDSFEKCERKMFKSVLHGCMEKAHITSQDVDMVMGGDLLNQTISASFAALDFKGSYIGLYGACSTMAESIGLAACLMDGNCADGVICITGSHYCTAERQYRFPLEMGTQRTPTQQWTVTATGGTYLSRTNTGAEVVSATFGKVMDMGIADVNNMGAAMAPAAADTIYEHLKAYNASVADYDLIVTGDLGALGKEIAEDLLLKKGVQCKDKLVDCGCLIFSPEQDTHMGGSGCGCSAAVLNGYILPQVKSGQLKKILFVATGALLSLTSSLQGDSIPSVAHAVQIEHS